MNEERNALGCSKPSNKTGGRCLGKSLARMWVAALMALALVAAAPAMQAHANPLSDLAAFFGFGAAEQVDEPATAAAFDESVVVDPATYGTWSDVIEQSTQNLGRIWSDKTVTTEDVTLPGSPNNLTGHKSEDSDFLVMLSALSSTSNTTTFTSKPLDIILVLDVSGSMDGKLDPNAGSTYEYHPNYNPRPNGRTQYYILQDDKYVSVEWRNFAEWWEPNDYSWAYQEGRNNWVRVTPKNSADDTTPGSVTFYERVTIKPPSRMEALQKAANNFITATAQKNDAIADENMRHRISVVKFADDSNNLDYGNDFTYQDYNYTQRLRPLTAYTSNNVSRLTDMVNDLVPAGATAADYGLAMANREFNDNKRPGDEDAQKVIVFFTDGDPNHHSDFDDSVAQDAVDTARALKGEGGDALIYTVGVFEGANAGNSTDKSNLFMQALSSNYPNATIVNGWYGYKFELGDRTEEEGADYYKTATNSSELNEIFEDILEQSFNRPASPTEVGSGDPAHSGYITFKDELGAYMQVDDFNEIIFADSVFNQKSVDTDPNTGVKTYTYEGKSEGNPLYPNAPLSDIIITVEPGKDLAAGDVVTVKIPASMIPLRNFTVETSENGETTMAVDEAWPIRVFYSVSLKPEVAQTLADGIGATEDDQALATYIRNNVKDGKVPFYSNLYEDAGDNPQFPDPTWRLGDTRVTFEPASTNPFYYFTENTPLYADEACSVPVTDAVLLPNKTYYYKYTYVANDDNATTIEEGVRAIHGNNFALLQEKFLEVIDGQSTILAGAPRLTRVDYTNSPKAENVTGTANQVINPLWDNPGNPNQIYVYLGNNGKLELELAGALQVVKDARVASDKGIDPSVIDGKEFAFTVELKDSEGNPINGVRMAEVRTLSGSVVKEPFELEFTNGRTDQGAIKLKNDEKLYIYGLDNGSTYTVTEDADSMPEGFELVDVMVDGQSNGDTGTVATGTIATGVASLAVFTNEYDVDAATVSGDSFVKYQKSWDGEERWDLAADGFDFYLFANDPANPMPEGSQMIGEGESAISYKRVNVTNGSVGNFGEVEFTKPGTYMYTVRELSPQTPVLGVNYSAAAYAVTVEVTDDFAGALNATVTMTKTANDDGSASDNAAVENNTAVFTNSFSATEVLDGPGAQKVYIDRTGGSKPLTDGMFDFRIKAVGDNAEDAPFPADAQKDENGWYTVSNMGAQVFFGAATFDESNVGKTYTYEFEEVIPAGAEELEDGTFKHNGMMYDGSKYTVVFTVGAEEQENAEGNTSAIVTVDKAYYKGVNIQPGATAIPQDQVVFTNIYDPEDFVIPGGGEAGLTGSKTLIGRDSKDGETFTFELTAANTATRDALAKDYVILGPDPASTSSVASVTGLTDGEAMPFNFDTLTVSKPGTYVFQVVETNAVDGNGMTFDKHTAFITVKVIDVDGKLVLDGEIEYDNGEGASTTTAAFTNRYRAASSYSADVTLNAGKVMKGRPLNAREFRFGIEGIESDTVSAEDADAKLAASDRDFTNEAGAAQNVTSLMFGLMDDVRFNQADAGKTFSYLVKEKLPSAEDQLPGVTYSEDEYRLDITVVDEGDGTMHAVTKVTKNGDESTAVTYDPTDGRDTILLAFENSYKAAPTTDFTSAAFGLEKVLTGRDWTENDSFEFTLAAQGDAPMPEKSTVTVTSPNSKAGDTIAFDFGAITYTAAGEYSYVVTETHAGETIDGVTYDKDAAYITVRVTDVQNGEHTGQLSATVIMKQNVRFNNVYDASTDVLAKLPMSATKTMSGRDMAEGEFNIVLEALANEGVSIEEAAAKLGFSEGETSETVPSPAGGADQTVEVFKIAAGAMELSLDGLGKVYTYKVSELGADGTAGSGGTAKGVTYDDTTYTIEVWATDNGDGTMTAHVKVTDSEGAVKEYENSGSAESAETPVVLAFENSYDAGDITVDLDDAEAGAKLAKVLKGRDWIESDSFEFTVTAQPENGPELKNPAALSGTGEGYGDGDSVAIELGELTFDEPGAYTYKVAETKGNIPGVTYDTHEATITITVTDNLDGTMSAEVKVEDGTFTNTYAAAPVTVDFDTQANAALNKVIDGRAWIDTDAFTFDVEADEPADAPMPAQNTIEVSNKTAADGENVPFYLGDITYATPGVYTYNVTEFNAGQVVNGLKFSDNMATVTVTVTDNNDGTLSAAVKVDNGTFTNTYETGNISVDLDTSHGANLTKVLNGRDWLDTDSFEFTVTAQPENGPKLENPAPLKAEGTKDGAPVAIELGELTFDEPGTYTYKVAETKGSIPGVTYDAHEATITITVTDNNNGELSATVEAKDTVFTNTYKAEGITVDLDDAEAGANLAKVLKGRDWIESDSFEFTVTAQPENGPKLKNPAALSGTGEGYGDGDSVAIELGELTFDKAGTYTYKVKEVVPEGATAENGWKLDGVTYDTHEATITITVTDNLDGTMSATVEAMDGTFTNTYDDGEITVDLDNVETGANLAKVLNGRDWLDTDSFEFTVTEQPENGPVLENPALLTGEGAKAGDHVAIKLGQLTFDEEGTYTYKVKETKGAIPGITYDEHTATIAITVTDNNNGTLSATVKTADPVFTNIYASGQFEGVPADFTLTKVLEGKQWSEGDEFTFVLTGASENTAGVQQQVTIGAANAKDNKAPISFGDFTYTEPGKYVYNVAEVKGTIPGIAYDTHTATITVTVSHDYDNGKLVARAAVAEGEFVNTYSADLNYGAAGGLKISKTLNGRNMTDGQFTYTVKAANEASAQKLGVSTEGTEFSTPAALDGQAAMVSLLPEDGLSFTQADRNQTFTYTVSENNGGAAGYTYDATEYTVVIAVVDNNNGTLTVTTTVTGAGEEKVYTYTTGQQTPEAAVLPFVNHYNASTENEGSTAASFNVSKTLTGRPLQAGEFTFEVKPQGVEGAQAVAAAKNDANGNVAFGPINYDIASLKAAQTAGYADKSGDVWTLKYTASEVTDGLASTGITATKPSFNFTVSVTDNGNGTLTAAVSLPEGAGFENTYATGDTPASINLTGTKVLDRNGLTGPETIEGKFQFTVTGEQGAPMPANATVSCDAQGNVDFGAIEFTLDDLNAKLGFTAAEADAAGEAEQPEARVGEARTADFTYTIAESGNLPGVTNDATVKTVVFTVTDDGAGHLTVERTSAGDTAFTFTNVYDIETPTTSSVTDQLEVTKTLTGRDMVDGEFAFELVDGTGTVVATGVNAAGKVVMDPITYTEPAEFDYTLREVDTSNGEKNGVEYDTAEFKIHTSVTDNGMGGLTVEHAFVEADEPAVFENTYTPAETYIEFEAAKMLTGRDLAEGEFEFVLTEDGEELSTATNDAEGKVQFDRIIFDEPGEHVYQIAEKKGNAEGVTYDETVYTATVTVTDNLEGNLVIDWAYGENGAPVFKNTYEEPKKPKPAPAPKPTLPGTGDTSLLPVAGVATAGIAAVAVGVYVGKRKGKSDRA